MTEVTIVTRTFHKDFNADHFSENVEGPIRKLLMKSEKVIKGIVVVINVEKDNPLAENIYSNGQTASSTALIEAFPEEIRSGRLIVHLCYNWGPNAGSATALNEGIEIASKLGAEFVMCWSLELEMNVQKIKKALRLIKEKQLFVVGFLRKGYQEHPAQGTPQNTGAIWSVDKLLSIGGFSERCNGADGKTVLTEKFGEVPRAGMENIYAMIELMIKYLDDFKWAMIKEKDLPEWNTTFPTDLKRTLMVEKMIARQSKVGCEWAGILLPDLSCKEVKKALDAHHYQD